MVEIGMLGNILLLSSESRVVLVDISRGKTARVVSLAGFLTVKREKPG